MIEYSDNITFFEEEYVEKYDIYKLSNEELDSFINAYFMVNRGIDKAVLSSDGEVLRENIKKEYLPRIFATRVKVNNISRLFFDEGPYVSIAKIDQLFDVKMSSFKVNEWNLEYRFKIRDRFLGLFDEVKIEDYRITFFGGVYQYETNNASNEFIIDEGLKNFDKTKIVYSLYKAIVDGNIFDVEIFEDEGVKIFPSFSYKKMLLFNEEIYFADCFKYISSVFDGYIEKILLEFNGFCWKEKYKTDEQLFCDEIVAKLLRKMNFSSVRFYHGIKEYGKDFIFSETDKFGHQIYYGLQVKAGDVSGKALSKIDEIIGQLDDAFSMPFEEIGSGNKHYISNFIIAISGNFTENAKDKIKNKIPRDKSGSVFFLDKEKIIQLAEKYWLL